MAIGIVLGFNSRSFPIGKWWKRDMLLHNAPGQCTERSASSYTVRESTSDYSLRIGPRSLETHCMQFGTASVYWQEVLISQHASFSQWPADLMWQSCTIWVFCNNMTNATAVDSENDFREWFDKLEQVTMKLKHWLICLLAAFQFGKFSLKRLFSFLQCRL